MANEIKPRAGGTPAWWPKRPQCALLQRSCPPPSDGSDVLPSYGTRGAAVGAAIGAGRRGCHSRYCTSHQSLPFAWGGGDLRFRLVLLIMEARSSCRGAGGGRSIRRGILCSTSAVHFAAPGSAGAPLAVHEQLVTRRWHAGSGLSRRLGRSGPRRAHDRRVGCAECRELR